MNREKEHGITWHVLDKLIDGGDILKQRFFPIEKDETGLTLEIKCQEQALSSFNDLIEELNTGNFTGIGIRLGKQKLIFERFTRLTKSYEGTYEGSGIGLYIVKKFVNSMGGEIYVKSKEGKGSEFTVILPFEIPPASLSEDAEDFSSSGISQIKMTPFKESANPNRLSIVPKSAPFSKPKILLVEDNAIAQKTTTLVLDALGCEIDLADCGAQAIALFVPGKYELIFLDIGLPDMRGYQVAERFREMEQGTEFHVPILGLSAHAVYEEEQLSASAAGIDEMYSKPLRKNQAAVLLKQYGISKNTSIDQDSESPSLPATMPNSLKVIDMNTILNHSNEQIHVAFKLLDLLVASLPEFRAAINQAYKTRNTPLLIRELLKFHSGIGYTNTPLLLHAVRALDRSIREGKHNDKLYQDLLEALDIFEKTYQSL